MNEGPSAVSVSNPGTRWELPPASPRSDAEDVPDAVWAAPSLVAPVYVVDASIGVKWFVDEEESRLAERLLIEAHEGRRRLVAPSLFWYEVANALWRSPESDEDLFRDLEALVVCPVERLDLSPADLPVLGALARRTKLTVYDAAYLMLSSKWAVPLLTEDRKLAAACAGLTPVLTLKQLFGSMLMETTEPYTARGMKEREDERS